MAFPALFPRPRFIEGYDESIRTSGPVHVATRSDLGPEAFEIDIDESGVRVRVGDSVGRRYAHATLDQLRREDQTWPGVTIADRPDFATRGYLLDISRDRVPTMAAFDRLIERLALCRYNQLQLYVEHTFAFVGHEAVWAHASPVTPEELSELDHRCNALGIELVVNQNTFGHFGRWLAHDSYRQRAECPRGYEIVDGFRLPPTVLAPTEDNAAFALSLVREQLACVSSTTVNIGCDETFELGRGVSAPEVARRGLGAVYGDHLRRICDPLIADGHRVLYWADVVRTHPELLASLPRSGGIPIVWNYDAPEIESPELGPDLKQILSRIGVDLDAPTDFATLLEPFVEHGNDFWVAPGTSTWQSLVGRLGNARANLVDAAEAGRSCGASGYLVTDWGDSGHLNPPAVSLAPLAFGGAIAWCAQANRDLDVSAVVDEHLVHDSARRFGSILESVGHLDQQTGVIARNASPIFQALVPSVTDLHSGDPDPDLLRDVVATLDDAMGALFSSRPACDDGEQLVDELAVAIELARHGADRLAARAAMTKLDAASAATTLERLIEQYRSAWLASSRPGGLSDSVSGLEATLARYRRR